MAANRPTPAAVFKCLQDENGGSGSVLDVQSVIRYGAFVGSVIESHRSLPRAMDHARSCIRGAVESNRSVATGTVILADTMSCCKGRFTRVWHAPRGGVWGCMVHANTLLPQSRNLISLAAGVACCETVRQLGGEQAVLRWVNDVLVGGRKLAGFLVESYTEPVQREEFTLVGFGININNNSFPSELSGSAVSFKEIIAKEIDLTSFTTLFLAKLAWNFGLLYHEEARELGGETYSGQGGRHLLLEKWLDCSDTIGKKVLYGFDVMTAPQYVGEARGIDGSGGLVLRLEDGHEKIEYSGEVRYLLGE